MTTTAWHHSGLVSYCGWRKWIWQL